MSHKRLTIFRLSLLLTGGIFMFSFYSCVDDVTVTPDACFICDTEADNEVNDTIEFYNCSVNAASFYWDFGDNTASSDANPTHQYAAAGTYTIKLIATNSDGKDIVSLKIDIKEHDFRDDIIGKYFVTETISCYGSCATCFSTKDTTISIFYGATDSTFSVFGRDVYLDANGHFSAFHYELTLANDSIHSSFMNGGSSCGQYQDHVGVRTSPIP
ncbi:MAG: PKD domain-containing protein [Bacteroidota bacterium]